MARMARLLALTVAAAFVVPALATAGHSGPGGSNRDFASGSGKNTFFIFGGPAHLSVAAHSDPDGSDPTGHVRAKGSLDPAGLTAFGLEGEVTCLNVEGNHAAIKYRFKHAQGAASPTFQDGGVQVFIEDNGAPGQGPPDRTAFDPPQTKNDFDPDSCSDPTVRDDYDPIDSGNFVVHQAP
jgi:hypothetical protein